MKNIFYWCILLGVVFMTSCNIEKRLPNYLQNVNDSTIAKVVKIPELKIQKNDMLSIRVYSASLNRETADEIYNVPSPRTQGLMGQSAELSSFFIVDVNGEIEYPQIGHLKVAGLTRLQLEDTIRVLINKSQTVLNDPKVIVRFQNLRVLVMGEVKQQGPISIPGERVTILEAIGLAGGTTDWALRQNVKVLREKDGQRELGHIDLSSNDIFTSPYYSLMQNDVIVVDPLPRKIRRLQQQEVMQQLGWIVTVLTTGLLVYNIFK